jgi:hypothetical protein
MAEFDLFFGFITLLERKAYLIFKVQILLCKQ